MKCISTIVSTGYFEALKGHLFKDSLKEVKSFTGVTGLFSDTLLISVSSDTQTLELLLRDMYYVDFEGI